MAKLSISKLLAKTIRLPLTADVKIDGEVVRDHEVAWVEVIGADNPKYLKEAGKLYIEAEAEIAEIQGGIDKAEKIPKDVLNKIIERKAKLGIDTLAHAIVDWDEEFFECPCTYENVKKFLSNEDHLVWFSKINKQVSEIDDFLPEA